jgi:hypothetical protein
MYISGLRITNPAEYKKSNNLYPMANQKKKFIPVTGLGGPWSC